jgi:ketosteroid isomerase-like protein
VTVDEKWRRFRASFEAALAEQLDGRPAAFKALWSHRPDVSLFGALDGLELGWAEVDARLDWVSERVRATDLQVENLRTTASTDLALTVDLERMRRLADGQAVPRVLRATQAYRLEDGEWRIFHRHANELRPSGR